MHPLVFLALPLLAFAGILLWIKLWVRRRNQRTRRPFKDMPRPAGWSLQSRTDDMMQEALTEAVIIGSMTVATCVASPKMDATSAFIISFSAATFIFLRLRRKMLAYANHSLGLSGEQLVGYQLDRLSSEEILVFHDIEVKKPGSKPWNIDHVALTRAGIFAFETKTRRIPRNGPEAHKLTFDGERIHYPAIKRWDRRSIEQARSAAEWLAKELTHRNATSIPVSPAVVMPGWYIERKARGNVTVLNENQLAGFLGNRPSILPETLFRALSNQLRDLSKVTFG